LHDPPQSFTEGKAGEEGDTQAGQRKDQAFPKLFQVLQERHAQHALFVLLGFFLFGRRRRGWRWGCGWRCCFTHFGDRARGRIGRNRRHRFGVGIIRVWIVIRTIVIVVRKVRRFDVSIGRRRLPLSGLAGATCGRRLLRYVLFVVV
jgi:hypothetical protein